jgi:hypothetical protein
MARYDDINTQNITVIGLCGAVGTFVLIVALQVMYYQFESREMARKVLSAPQVGPESVLNEQRTRLATYGWIDREHQLVAVPIDVAMSQVLSREQQVALGNSANAN